MAGNLIGKQINISRAWPVSGVLFLIGFVPGMPNTLFLAAGTVAGIVGYLATTIKEDESSSKETYDKEEQIEDKMVLEK